MIGKYVDVANYTKEQALEFIKSTVLIVKLENIVMVQTVKNVTAK